MKSDELVQNRQTGHWASFHVRLIQRQTECVQQNA